METGLFSAAFSISGEKFSKELDRKREEFNLQFESKFGLTGKVHGGKVQDLKGKVHIIVHIGKASKAHFLLKTLKVCYSF